MAREWVIDTYLAMWHEYVEAARTTKRDAGQLSRYAAGDALATLKSGLAQNRKQGEVTRGEPTFAPRVTSLKLNQNPRRAKIADCGGGKDWLQYDASTGERIKDQPAGKHRVRAVATKVAGSWMITSLRVQGVGSCSAAS